MNKTIENVEGLIRVFGDKIKTDNHLLLLYWLHVDEVEMDKETISTKDFLQNATNPADIINAKIMLDCTRGVIK